MMPQSVKRSFIFGAAAVITAVAPVKQASATVGALPLCVGTYKCGMAGAGMTIASDPTAAAINPALAARMGNSAIISAGWFHAEVERDYSRVPQTGSLFGNATGGKQKSKASDFLNMSMGVNYRYNDDIGLNISMYPGAGGATDWDNSRTRTGGGTNTYGDDRQMRWRMMNLQIGLAYAPNDTSSYGLGVVLARSDMKTNSIYGATPSGALTPNANPQVVDKANGAGFQIGGVWDIGDRFTVAADYHSKVWVERFKKYTNVFNSTVDRPATLSLGMDLDVRDDTTVALDFKHIFHSGIGTFQGEPGAEGGFGWKDVNMVMLGVEHQTTEDLKLRAGFSYNSSPIDEKHIFANTLLPAIVTTHYTVGGTYAMDDFEFGVSGYITGLSDMIDDGTGDGYSNMGKGGLMSHQQWGTQLSVKYNF